MSQIYFHGIDDTAEVHGSERAHFGVFCTDITNAVLRVYIDEWGDKKSILRQLFPSNHYIHQSRDFERDFRVALACAEKLILGKKEISAFGLQLNTALRLGSDAVKLGTRLHGQCEIHTYVEGKNREWLADIIEEGRRTHFFRKDAGWEEVIELLKSSDDSPIVTSYSVCEQFPNAYVANFQPKIDENEEEDWDGWYDIPDDKQWEMAIKGLRESGGGLEIKPENWDTFYFSDNIDANTLLEILTTK